MANDYLIIKVYGEPATLIGEKEIIIDCPQPMEAEKVVLYLIEMYPVFAKYIRDYSWDGLLILADKHIVDKKTKLAPGMDIVITSAFSGG